MTEMDARGGFRKNMAEYFKGPNATSWKFGREYVFHSDPYTPLHKHRLVEKGMATHSSILTWRIPWTEKPGGLQSTGLQRVRNDWLTELNWTEAFGTSQVVLVVKNPSVNAGRYNRCRFDPWIGKMSRGRHGCWLQYSYLENPMDRGAWQSIVHRVAKSGTWLKVI